MRGKCGGAYRRKRFPLDEARVQRLRELRARVPLGKLLALLGTSDKVLTEAMSRGPMMPGTRERIAECIDRVWRDTQAAAS